MLRTRVTHFITSATIEAFSAGSVNVTTPLPCLQTMHTQMTPKGFISTLWEVTTNCEIPVEVYSILSIVNGRDLYPSVGYM